jgi:hypothetical protein
MQSMKKRLMIFIIVIIVLLGIGWFLNNKSNQPPEVQGNLFTPTPNDNLDIENAPSSPIDFVGVQVDTSDWLNYTNSEGGYSLKYPPNWKIEDVTNLEYPGPPYHNSIVVYADLNMPLSKNFRSVGIYCCTAPKTLDSLRNEIGTTATDDISSQELDINRNKVIILNTGSADNAGMVLIYIVAKNKTFMFNVMQPDVYNEQAYKIAVGIIRNFEVIE